MLRLIAKGGVAHIARDPRNAIAIAAGVVADVSAIGRVQPGPGRLQTPALAKLLIQPQLHPLTAGLAGVFITGAPAAAAVDHNLIIGIGLEQGGSEQPIADPRLAADLHRVVGGGFQAEVEAALVIGAVGEFVNGWRLEAAAGGEVDVPRVGQGIFQRARGQPFVIAGITAVIAIAWGDVVVVRVEPYRAVANPGIEREFVSELPLGLQVGVDVPHQVAFVTAQRALFAILRRAVDHHKVFIPFAPLAHVLVVETGGERDGHQQLSAMGQPGINPLVVTGKVDHPAGMARLQLRRARDRLELSGFTFSSVHHNAEIVLGTELALIAQAGLGLSGILAGIILVAARRLARVIAPFIGGQATGVIGFDIHAIQQQSQLTDVVDAHPQPGVRQIFARAAVIAIAMGGEAIG